MKPLLSIFSLLSVTAICMSFSAAEAGGTRSLVAISIGPGPGSAPHESRRLYTPTGSKNKRQNKPASALIPPSVAAKRAQSAFGGKILSVQRNGTVYLVKLRGDGYVHEVQVNAITGNVIGR